MKHQDVGLGYIHLPYNWSYANATARTTATGFVAADLGKFARQTDTDTIWMLTATTPTWIQIGGGGGSITVQEIDGSPSVSTTTLRFDQVYDKLTDNGGGTVSVSRRIHTPTEFSGLVLWLKADGTLWQDSARTIPVTANNNPVGAWDDSSGNNNHALQAGASNRPLYKTNVWGSLPAIRFDGADDSLATPSISLTTMTVIVVFRANTGTLIFEHGTDISSVDGFALGTSTGASFAVRKGGVSGWIDIKDWTSSWALFDKRMCAVLTHINAASDMTCRINGSPHHTLVSLSGTPGVASTAAVLNICSRNQTSLFLSADVFEILIYSPVLADNDLRKVENYLNSRWQFAPDS